jgi:hypothetical protein
MTQYAKGRQQPDDNTDHHDYIDNLFYLSVHRNIGVDEPEQYADDNLGDDEGDHRVPPV